MIYWRNNWINANRVPYLLIHRLANLPIPPWQIRVKQNQLTIVQYKLNEIWNVYIRSVAVRCMRVYTHRKNFQFARKFFNLPKKIFNLPRIFFENIEYIQTNVKTFTAKSYENIKFIVKILSWYMKIVSWYVKVLSRYVKIVSWYVKILSRHVNKMSWYLIILSWCVKILSWYMKILSWYVKILRWYVKIIS